MAVFVHASEAIASAGSSASADPAFWPPSPACRGQIVETPVGELGDFPCSPDSLALAKPAVENIVCLHVTFGPIALFVTGILAASDEKPADVINAIASHRTVDERELKIDAVPISRAIIIETGPRP
jgi:hypothetical protein